MQDTVRMLQEQIGRMYSPRQNSSWQAGHHSNPQKPTNTIRVMATRISHSCNSNPQTPTNLLKPKAPSSSSFQRDPPAPFVTDHQRDPTSPFVTDYQRDPPAPFVTDHQRDPPSPFVADHQRDPTSPFVTDCHRDPPSSYQRDQSSLPSSVAASFEAKEPPAGDGMTSPLPVATDKSTMKSLSSSAITRDKLQSVAAVLEQHHRLKGEKNAGSLAIKLAKDALFGDEVLKLCTPMGNRSLPALPTKELQQLKAIIYQQFPQYANSPSEFEELWQTCIIAVSAAIL